MSAFPYNQSYEPSPLNKATTRLQQLRISRNLTQATMARLMGMNVRNYITLEKSQSLANRKITTIIKLCKILNCSISDLVNDDAMLQDIRFMEYQERKRNEPDYVPEELREQKANPNKRFRKAT